MTDTLTEVRYRFDHPTTRIVLSDLRIHSTDPRPGDSIPDFRITVTDGSIIDNASLLRDGRPTLMIFGSLTCRSPRAPATVCVNSMLVTATESASC